MDAERIKALLVIYTRLAFADGFRQGVHWVPDPQTNSEAQGRAFEWARDAGGSFDRAISDAERDNGDHRD